MLKWGKAFAVLADYESWMNDSCVFREIYDAGISEAYVCLPEITRQSKLELTKNMMQCIPDGAGVLIRTPDQLEMAVEYGFKGPVAGDSFLYAYNSHSMKLYKELIPDIQFISSDELTDNELKLTGGDVIFKAYGHQVLMVTNQCLMKNYYGCRQGIVRFRNENNDRFFTANRCSHCLSVIYDSRIINMTDRLDEIPYEKIMLDLTVENAEQTREVLSRIDSGQCSDAHAAGFTRGHHYKGVE